MHNNVIDGGREFIGHMWNASLFDSKESSSLREYSAVVKFVNALNKPP